MSRRGRNSKARAALVKPPTTPKSKQCPVTGKRGYKTREDAVTAMANFSRAQRFRGQRVYPCPHCGRFHTTSQIERSSQ